jgi:hypothetical protein
MNRLSYVPDACGIFEIKIDDGAAEALMSTIANNKHPIFLRSEVFTASILSEKPTTKASSFTSSRMGQKMVKQNLPQNIS